MVLSKKDHLKNLIIGYIFVKLFGKLNDSYVIPKALVNELMKVPWVAPQIQISNKAGLS